MFKATVTKAAINLEGTGYLDVVNGKVRKHSKVLKKGTDPVNGIEFVLSIASGENIQFEKWERKDEKLQKVEDTTPKVYPLTVTLFLQEAENAGKCFINIFDNLETLKLPTNLAEGFSGTITIGDDKGTTLFANGDYSKASVYLPMLLDNPKVVESALAFNDGSASSGGSYGGGAKAQTLAEKAADRLVLFAEFRKDSSPVQQEFVALSALYPDLTVLDFLGLLTN